MVGFSSKFSNISSQIPLSLAATFKKSRIQEQYEVPEAKVKDVAIKTESSVQATIITTPLRSGET